MTNADRRKMQAAIETHAANLEAIFPNATRSGAALCKALLRLERKANWAAACLLNTNTLHLQELNRFTGYDVEQATEEEQDAFFDKILASVCKLLGPEARELVFINYDARGYTLKIKSEKAQGLKIHKDFGGYGIIAPDLTPTH